MFFFAHHKTFIIVSYTYCNKSTKSINFWKGPTSSLLLSDIGNSDSEKKGKKEGAKTGGRIKIVIRSASPGKKNKKTKEIKEVKINSSDVKVIKI